MRWPVLMLCVLMVLPAFGFSQSTLVSAPSKQAPEEQAIRERLRQYYEHRSKGDSTLPAFFADDADMRLSSTATTIQQGRNEVLQRLKVAVGQPPPRLQVQKINLVTDSLALVDATLATDVNGGTTSYTFYVMVKREGLWRFKAVRSYQLPTPK